MKLCSKCKIQKPLDDFYPVKKGRCRTWCKECEKKYQKELYAKNPEREKERARVWRERYSESYKAIRRANRQKTYITEAAKKYRITKEEVVILLKNKECACCKQPFDSKIALKKCNIDHCHITNKVRGLVCSRCNTVLGLCEDNQYILSQIIKYLKRQTLCTTISRKKNA